MTTEITWWCLVGLFGLGCLALAAGFLVRGDSESAFRLALLGLVALAAANAAGVWEGPGEG